MLWLLQRGAVGTVVRVSDGVRNYLLWRQQRDSNN